MSDVCCNCNGSGEVAINAKTCRYVSPGPVPDDAKNIIGSTCFQCVGTGFVHISDLSPDLKETAHD